MATPRVPLVLALHGEPDRLVSKPDTYAELLQLARKPAIFFQKLAQFKDEEITFRFMWDDTEVVLDDSAFEFVQARARLRIITPWDRDPSVKPECQSSSPRPAVASPEPPPKRVKVEDSLGGQSRVEIDLTNDELPVDNPIPAQDEEPLLVIEHPEGARDQNSQPDIQEQTVVGGEATTQRHPRQSQEAATQIVQPSPLQAVAIRRLTAHNFVVDEASPTRTVPPQRQLIPHQWVDCREVWPGSEASSDPNLGRFSIRVLTEHNIMPCTFKSEMVHVSTLKNYVQDRGYPSSRPTIPETHSDNLALARNGIVEGADVHIYNSAKPGIYLLPPKRRSQNKYSTGMSVTLELRLGWKFKSIYPWTKIKALGGVETAEWKVYVDKKGNIFSNSGPEKCFGHLSWEPTVDFTLNPAMLLTPANSVVLKRQDVLTRPHLWGIEFPGGSSYFQPVLAKQLGLPEDMIQDFQDYFDATFHDEIQEWEDRFSVAVSFVPQCYTDVTARISITPRPDTTARILMVFAAVDTTGKHNEWASWTDRRCSVEDALKAKNWAGIIGIKPEALKDGGNFRAIEWSVLQAPARKSVVKKVKKVKKQRSNCGATLQKPVRK